MKYHKTKDKVKLRVVHNNLNVLSSETYSLDLNQAVLQVCHNPSFPYVFYCSRILPREAMLARY